MPITQERWSYEKRCKRCNHVSNYILTSENVNPGIDVSATIKNKISKEMPDFEHCEMCGAYTRQELIAFIKS